MMGALNPILRARPLGNARPGEPREVSWGWREITIADPARNQLTFYTKTETP